MDEPTGHAPRTPTRTLVWVVIGLLAFVSSISVTSAFASTSLRFVALLALYIPLIDTLDVCIRLLLLRASADGRSTEDPVVTRLGSTVSDSARRYAVVASVHNAEPEIPLLLHWSRTYKRHLWLIDDASSDFTAKELRAKGIRCVESETNRLKPGAIRRLLQELPSDIEAVLVIDPDTRIMAPAGGRPDLDLVVGSLLANGWGAICPRITVRRENFLTAMQDLEYALTVSLGRRALRDTSVTSGISLYRRNDLVSTLQEHSLSVYAEDLENSLILLARGKKIWTDDRLVAETEGKKSIPDLVSQRIGWAFGHLKVYSERVPELMRIAGRGPIAAYQFVVYLGLIGIFLHPVRQAAAVLLMASFVNGVDGILGTGLVPDLTFTDPAFFAVSYLQYTALVALVILLTIPGRERWRHLPLVPFYFPYALLMTIPVTLGFLNWVTLKLFGRRLLDDHYQDTEALVRALNGSTGALETGA